jgi:hypothetical protein
MDRRRIYRVVQLTLIALVALAIAQELRKPGYRRTWHGKVLLVPYDFRLPTWERIKETYWNPYESHILVPMVFGLGWTVNLFSLFENLGFFKQPGLSEESFLMPGKRMRQILRGAKE